MKESIGIAVENWIDRPLFICDQTHNVLDISQEIPLINEYFIGKVFLAIKGVSNSDSDYFLGKKRKFEYVIQGRFTNPLSFANLYTGHAFQSPLAMKPPHWLISALKPLISYFQPSAEIDLDSASPYILSPFMVRNSLIVIY